MNQQPFDYEINRYRREDMLRQAERERFATEAVRPVRRSLRQFIARFFVLFL